MQSIQVCQLCCGLFYRVLVIGRGRTPRWTGPWAPWQPRSLASTQSTTHVFFNAHASAESHGESRKLKAIQCNSNGEGQCATALAWPAALLPARNLSVAHSSPLTPYPPRHLFHRPPQTPITQPNLKLHEQVVARRAAVDSQQAQARQAGVLAHGVQHLARLEADGLQQRARNVRTRREACGRPDGAESSAGRKGREGGGKGTQECKRISGAA